MQKITYINNHAGNNVAEVLEFIGEQPECGLCHGYGEYETDNGPRGCLACNSRLIFFIDYAGNRRGADWGDTIVKGENGLELVEGNMDYEK